MQGGCDPARILDLGVVAEILESRNRGARAQRDHGVQDSLAELLKEIDGKNARIPTKGSPE